MTNEIVQKNKKNRHRYNKQSRLVSFEEEVVPKNAAEQILLKETPVNVDDKSKKKKKKGRDTSVDAHEETVDEVANMHEVCENSKSKKKKKKTKITRSRSLPLTRKIEAELPTKRQKEIASSKRTTIRSIWRLFITKFLS
jgi:hypothetical protein